MMTLESFLTPTQEQLFNLISKKFRSNAVESKDNFILVKGIAPILLVAHLDTVHEEPVKDICATNDGNILMSPQGIGGDDRCGVFALNKIYESAPVKPFLLFTCEEEIGGIGAQAFCDCFHQKLLPNSLKKLKLIIEIDRKGTNDAVYYDCYNPDFEAYITSKGFKTAHGSFSDISVIAPTLGIAAVNLSAGYYNAHKPHEFINRQELEHTISCVINIVADSLRDNFPQFPYLDAYDFDDWDYFENELEPLPCEYEQIYSELLEQYNEEELEELRRVYGNKVLHDIYLDLTFKEEK